MSRGCPSYCPRRSALIITAAHALLSIVFPRSIPPLLQGPAGRDGEANKRRGAAPLRRVTGSSPEFGPRLCVCVRVRGPGGRFRCEERSLAPVGWREKVAGPRGGGGGRREASQQYGANRTENESITLTKQLRGCHAPLCMFRGGGRRRSPSLRKPPRPPKSLATSRAQPRPKLFTTRLRKIKFLSFLFFFFSFLGSCGCFQLLRLLEDPPVPLQGVGRGGEGGGRRGGGARAV